MSTLERAIAIAVEAHSGQRDKAGAPYVLHPLRVMLALETDEERIVGVLHDVLEDSSWTLERLRREGFSERVLEGVAAVTIETNERYEAFVRRASRNRLGRRVKRADLLDNLDRSRLPVVTERDEARLAKYRRALDILDRCG